MTAPLLLAAFLAVTPAVASSNELAGGDVAAELHRINESLQVLVSAAKAQADRARIDLMLRRAELTAQELAPITAELRSARQNSEGLEEELRITKEQLKVAEESAADPQTPEREVKGLEEQIRRWKDEIERLQLKNKRVADRLSALEADSAARTAEIEQIKAAVDRILLAPNPEPR